MWYNEEHYPDPTAAEAMANVPCAGERPCREADDEGVMRLAEAVVVSAAREYLDLLRDPFRSGSVLARQKELEDFFTGSWFRRISGLDGRVILRKIREEARTYERT